MPALGARNAVGLFAVGAQPDRLPGGRASEEAVREGIEKTWSKPPADLPGMSAPEILAAAAQGTLKDWS